MRLWQWCGLAGLAATVLYVLSVSETVNAGCLLLIGSATIAAAFAGPRHFGAQPRWAWRLMGSAAACFLIGVLVRPVVDDLAWPLPMLADAATLPGYLLFAGFLIGLLRARRSLDRHAVLDGLIVCLAAGLAATLLLAMPAAAISHRPALQSMVAGWYPVLDAVVLLLAVNLTFTTRVWPVSLLAFMGGLSLMLTGDIAYAIIGTVGETYASPLLDTPFLLAYASLGMAALHPSVVEMSRATRRPVQAWSWRRMALLAPALATPFALLVVLDEPDRSDRLLIGLCGALIVAMLLVRAISAVHAQVAAQHRAEHQARHDARTGLPNRRMFTEEVERLTADGRPVWVFLLDLDGFKFINDSWGHDTGDRVVVEVASRLRAAAPGSVAVASLGGDEFALAYTGDRAGAEHLAEQVRACFVQPFTAIGADLTVTASIGIAFATGGGAESLIRDADTAMYRAKAEGPGSCTIFDEAMHEQVRERIELEMALRQALGDGQLHVAYQPIVRLATGEPLGAEALVRWMHPERGPVSPAVFIPIAEDAGLITELGTWVRQEALRQLGAWRSDGTVADDFYLSINVSPRQLTDPQLPLVVSAELLRYGVPARCVALEMTETVMVDGSTAVGRVLFELRELGVQLLIDDFGTGFSALGYLRRFPVTGVKIDRSFVTGLGVGSGDDEIVRAVVAMSHALGLKVIAEGVETRVQRDALDAIGVTHGQGWLWGPAVPAAEFATHWHTEGAAALAARTRPITQ